MAVGNQYCLSSKLPIHLDIKYNVNIDVLISGLDLPFTHIIRCNAVKLLKLNTDVLHLFCNSLGPKVSPGYLSISYAYFNVLGTCIPNLCDVRQYLDFTLEIILSLCCKFSLIHQFKAGLSLISFATAYSARSTGLDCLSSFSVTQ